MGWKDGATAEAIVDVFLLNDVARRKIASDMRNIESQTFRMPLLSVDITFVV